MSTATAGVTVRYCGHRATFVADVLFIAGACVVRSNGPLDLNAMNRTNEAYSNAMYHLFDLPDAGFWRPDLGVFVVPRSQLRETEEYIQAQIEERQFKTEAVKAVLATFASGTKLLDQDGREVTALRPDETGAHCMAQFYHDDSEWFLVEVAEFVHA